MCFKTRYSIESVNYPGPWELLQIVRKDFKIAKKENVWTDNCFRTIAVVRCKFQKINVCLFSCLSEKCMQSKILRNFFFNTSLRFVAMLCCSVIVNLNLTFNKLWNKHYNVRIYISSSLSSSSCILLGICWYNDDNKLVLNRNQLWCQRDSYFQFRTRHPVDILKILDLVALKYFYDIRYLISMPIKP